MYLLDFRCEQAQVVKCKNIGKGCFMGNSGDDLSPLIVVGGKLNLPLTEFTAVQQIRRHIIWQ